MVVGVLLILHSGRLSGRVLSPDEIFAEGGLLRTIKHIFFSSPFAGYKQDKRILLYGLAGLCSLYGGIALFAYVILWIYATAGVGSR